MARIERGSGDGTAEYLEGLERSGSNIIQDFALLKQVSRETTWEEVKKLNLIERLKAACGKAWVDGSGLAAIQIGVPVRFGSRGLRMVNKMFSLSIQRLSPGRARSS